MYQKIEELAKTDIVAEAFLKITKREIKEYLYGKELETTEESVEQTILDERFYKLVWDIISFQTYRANAMESELKVVNSNK